MNEISRMGCSVYYKSINQQLKTIFYIYRLEANKRGKGVCVYIYIYIRTQLLYLINYELIPNQKLIQEN